MATIKLEVETHTQASVVIALLQEAIARMDPDDRRLSLAQKALAKMDPDAKMPRPGAGEQLDLVDQAEEQEAANRVEPEEGLGHETEPPDNEPGTDSRDAQGSTPADEDDQGNGDADADGDPGVSFQCVVCDQEKPASEESGNYPGEYVCIACDAKLRAEAAKDGPPPEIKEETKPSRPEKVQCPFCKAMTSKLETRNNRDYFWRCQLTKCGKQFTTPIVPPPEPPPPDPEAGQQPGTKPEGKVIERRYHECPTCAEHCSLVGVDAGDENTQLWECPKGCGGGQPIRTPRWIKQP